MQDTSKSARSGAKRKERPIVKNKNIPEQLHSKPSTSQGHQDALTAGPSRAKDPLPGFNDFIKNDRGGDLEVCMYTRSPMEQTPKLKCKYESRVFQTKYHNF